jgi:hypothetical protein
LGIVDSFGDLGTGLWLGHEVAVQVTPTSCFSRVFFDVDRWDEGLMKLLVCASLVLVRFFAVYLRKPRKMSDAAPKTANARIPSKMASHNASSNQM